MEFLDTNLNYQRVGSVVVVRLGSTANVQLLDNSNFDRYLNDQSYTSYGRGYYTTSPVRLAIPQDGHWHVAVDLGGNAGQVSASVEVIPTAA
jgi:hypothetical protein